MSMKGRFKLTQSFRLKAIKSIVYLLLQLHHVIFFTTVKLLSFKPLTDAISKQAKNSFAKHLVGTEESCTFALAKTKTTRTLSSVGRATDS